MPDQHDANRPEHEQSTAWTVDPYAGKCYGYDRPLPISPSGGRDIFSGMPWWVRAVALVGVPAIISLWLVAITTGTLTRNVEANGRQIETIIASARLHDERVTVRFERLQGSSDVQTKLLRSICQSVAKNDVQREKCNE